MRQDGWTTARSAVKIGATGGPYLIRARIRWHDSDEVIMAYDYDPEIGDLWKCYWIEEKQTFDLEAEEVLEAMKKWRRRYLSATATAATQQWPRPRVPTRHL